MKIFLTGGTGLLGSHVAERLRGNGVAVRALTRPRADTRFLQQLGCDLVSGNLLGAPQELAREMEGCRGLVHAAGEVYSRGSFEGIYAVNVDGTRRVLSAAAMAGVLQALHISTVAVYGEVDGPVSEDSPWSSRIPSGDRYAITKREAEEVAAEFHGKGGLGVTILRPTALFGERDRRFLPMLVKVLKIRLVPLMGSGRNLLAAGYAGNAAEAVAKALDGLGAGDAFNISEDLSVTPRSLFEGLGHELGITPYFVPVPGSFVRTAAVLAGTLGLGVPGVRGLSLSRAVRLALEDNPYSGARARKVLGWLPRFSLDDALIRMGTWLREKEKGND